MAARLCKQCNRKHPSPTGKKCQFATSSGDDIAAVLAAINGIKEDVGGLAQRINSLEDGPREDTSNRSDVDDHSEVTFGRQPEDIQQRVSARMADLNLLEISDDEGEQPQQTSRRTRGKKSGIARTAEDIVQRDIRWPHYPVYLGPERRAAKYTDLTPEQFVFGYLDNMEAESPGTRDTMLKHLKSLMQDAMEFSWANARSFHGILLQQFEMNRMTWQDGEDIARMRGLYAQRAPSASTTKDKASTPNTHYCAAFQNGTCQQSGDHTSARGFVRHVCAFCLRVTKNAFAHAEADCQRKLKHEATPQQSATTNGEEAGDW